MSGQSSPITIPVSEAKRLSGLGHTTIYKLISEGTLKSTTVGKRRLISFESLRKLVEPQQEAA